MTWKVEYTEEFDSWWKTLSDETQDAIDRTVHILETMGPRTPFPYSSGVHGSRHSHMRELRIQHKGDPYRILYAFDPTRTALLLIGGNKGGDDRWYKRFVPLADRLYDKRLNQLKKEGII